jgi:hypothetical protein
VETPVVTDKVVGLSPQFAFVLADFLCLFNEANSEDERTHTEGVPSEGRSQRKAKARGKGGK